MKGVGELICALWETDVKYLWDVFRLTDRQPVQVNFRLRPMYTLSVCRHLFRSKFYSAFPPGDSPYQPLLVRFPSAHAQLYQCLLRHPIPDCARQVCHVLGLLNICYQYALEDEDDEHGTVTLSPLQTL